MPKDADQAFYDRADAHIHLSNEQMKEAIPGEVSASMLFSSARFNTWLTAAGVESGAELAAKRDENVAYSVEQYRLALLENMDNYIEYFNQYMQKKTHND
ncbi:MAG: DUF3144 domain-containing protein [Methylophilaceae bacterium]|nr:DUF3144 domain-containing protein [Methylophilaceae bacterium]